MSTPADTLHGLVLEHLKLVGISDEVTGPLKEQLDSGKKEAEGSTLYQLFSTLLPALATPAAGTGSVAMKPGAAAKVAPPPPAVVAQAQQQAARMSQGNIAAAPPVAPAAAAAPMVRASDGSVTMTPQQAAYMQSQMVVDNRPLVAKPPAVRDSAADAQLMSAAAANEDKKIPGLVEKGAYVNMQDASGSTPLLAATEAGHLEAVKVLLEKGADVNLGKKDGTTPLIVAYKTNKKKILKELTAAAFSTLNRAVQPGNSGWNSMGGFYGEEEGISQIDILQMRDETQKLLGMKTSKPANTSFHPNVAPAKADAGEGEDGSMLREGAVRLLLEDLLSAAADATAGVEQRSPGRG